MKSILITGCNRGIGLGLVRYLTEQSNSLKHIIATCRNPQNAKVRLFSYVIYFFCFYIILKYKE